MATPGQEGDRQPVSVKTLSTSWHMLTVLLLSKIPDLKIVQY